MPTPSNDGVEEEWPGEKVYKCNHCDTETDRIATTYCGHCLARGCHNDDPGVLQCDSALPDEWERETVRIRFELFSTHYDRQKQSVAVFVPADVDVDTDGTPDDSDEVWKAVGAAGYGETGTPRVTARSQA